MKLSLVISHQFLRWAIGFVYIYLLFAQMYTCVYELERSFKYVLYY